MKSDTMIELAKRICREKHEGQVEKGRDTRDEGSGTSTRLSIY